VTEKYKEREVLKISNKNRGRKEKTVKEDK
jgi:hypothetical protein